MIQFLSELNPFIVISIRYDLVSPLNNSALVLSITFDDPTCMLNFFVKTNFNQILRNQLADHLKIENIII